MIQIVTFGFEYSGKTYGWYKKDLYKLPKHKPLKKQIRGSTLGYYINREFKSLKTLKELTVEINGKLILNDLYPF